MSAAVGSLVIVGIGVLLVPIATMAIPEVDRRFTRFSMAVCRVVVERSGRKNEERSRLLQSVHATSTYPVYASKTIVYAVLVAVATTLLGTAVAIGVLVPALSNGESVPAGLSDVVPTTSDALGSGQLFFVFTASVVTAGVFGGLLVYHYRWWTVRSRANQRRVLIDESVARTIAFVYALSRSGMVYPQVVRTVSRNRRAFGESAEEIGVVVKDMDLFGADLGTALERIADRTPSEQFADFAENFANVLQSGQNVSRYLREQYDQYQEERVANQERLLEMFAALGEAYVAALVAGPLFLITILLIFGLLTGGLVDVLQLAIYLLIPVANLAFGGYVNSISEPLSPYRAPLHPGVTSESRSIDVRRVSDPTESGGRGRDDGPAIDDPDRAMNVIRLAAYDRFRRLRAGVVNPLETVVSRPALLLALTVPLACGTIALRLWSLDNAGSLTVQTADDVVIQSALFVFATFAIVQERKTRRIRQIEAAVPDFLERLASTNEAGMTFTESLGRIERGGLGVLNVEVERLLSDVNWGARTETALHRFNERIGSSTVARVVALLTNAMAASGNLAPVIRIAADEAREDRRLRRTRRQEMFMYVLIIYLAFFIFLGIGVALQTILIPAIPSPEELGGLAQGPGGVGVNLPIDPAHGVDKDAYTLLLYHAAVVQAVCSGLVAGVMGEGNVASGAKHVTVLLLVAYVVFLVV